MIRPTKNWGRRGGSRPTRRTNSNPHSTAPCFCRCTGSCITCLHWNRVIARHMARRAWR
jgi:hypothetical protein